MKERVRARDPHFYLRASRNMSVKSGNLPRSGGGTSGAYRDAGGFSMFSSGLYAATPLTTPISSATSIRVLALDDDEVFRSSIMVHADDNAMVERTSDIVLGGCVASNICGVPPVERVFSETWRQKFLPALAFFLIGFMPVRFPLVCRLVACVLLCVNERTVTIAHNCLALVYSNQWPVVCVNCLECV
jgi:hypothetical protein